MNSKKLFDLPIAEAGCGRIQLLTNGVTLLAKYEYLVSQQSRVGGLLFEDVNALQFVDEQHGRHVPECYDAVVEVLESEWLAKLAAKDSDPVVGSIKDKHHFVILFSSNGYLEVIASTVSQVDPHESERNVADFWT